jgi:GntR family transcriptional repressor for pyruvate dehydrogenase complex
MRIHLQLASFTQDDLVEVRLLIERLAARNAAEHATPGDIAELRDIVDQMQGVHTTAAYNDLDAAFHIRIVRSAGNGLSAALMAAMREALRDAMVTAFESLDDVASTMQKLTDEHAAIVDAIAAGKGELAGQLVADHIVGFYRAVGFTDLKSAG